MIQLQGLFHRAFSDAVPTHTTQTERTWMTKFHSLYFTKKIPDSTSFVPSPKVVSLVTLILNFHFSPSFRNLRFLVTNGSGRRVTMLFLRAPVCSTKNWPMFLTDHSPIYIPLSSFSHKLRPPRFPPPSLSSMPHQCGAAPPHQSRRHLLVLPSPNDRLYFPHASHAQPDPLSHKWRWDPSPFINRGGQLTLINVLVFTQTAQPWSFLSSHPLFGYSSSIAK